MSEVQIIAQPDTEQKLSDYELERGKPIPTLSHARIQVKKHSNPHLLYRQKPDVKTRCLINKP